MNTQARRAAQARARQDTARAELLKLIEKTREYFLKGVNPVGPQSNKLALVWLRLGELKRSTKDYIVDLLTDLETLGYLDSAGQQLETSTHIDLPSFSCEAACDLIYDEIPPVRDRIEFQLREMLDTLEQEWGGGVSPPA